MNIIPGRLAIALGFSTAAHVGIVWMAGERLPSSAAPAQRALSVSMTPAAPRAVLNSIAPTPVAAVAPAPVRPREPESLAVIDEPDRVVSARASPSVEALDAAQAQTRGPELTLEAREGSSSMLAVAVTRQAETVLSKAAQRDIVEKPAGSQSEAVVTAPTHAKLEPLEREAAARASAPEPMRRDPGDQTRAPAAVTGEPGAERSAQPAAGNEPPTYPWVARMRGHQGRVVLSVWVSADGEAERLAVLRSSGYAALDRAALEAVGNWHFRAARRGGDDTGSMLYVPVVFRLDE